MVNKLVYDKMPVCKAEILRYSGVRGNDENINSLVDDVVNEARNVFSYGVCYDIFDLTIKDNICDFGVFKIESSSLSKNLNSCDRAIIFAATVGSSIDRLIAKYGRLSPTRALILQAFGAQKIESLCDAFCEDVARMLDFKLKPRFSPGYGDVPMDAQIKIFDVLNPAKNIGLCLNDSLLMSPSKSVTAIVGITNQKYEQTQKPNKCKSCIKGDCEFRS